eukprot:gene7083-7883_t
MENEQLISGIDSTNEILKLRLTEWLTWDKNEDTLKEIKELLLAKDHDGLLVRLEKRMEFGTAGLRSVLGAGFARMNDLTIIQTSQGLCKYLITQFPGIKNQGIVIGHDARYGSHRFARLSAAVFLSQDIKVYLFSDIVPTPFVPYSVLKYKCSAGIMVTASHNPKQDNGYKVYYSNGAQITSPHDKGISNSIMQNLHPWDQSWDADLHKQSSLCTDPLNEVMHSYFHDIQVHCHNRELNQQSELKIVYTAMHGVGHKYAEKAFESFSLNPFISVTEQAIPDPDFPTVQFPNPEEGKSSLNLSIKTANENGSSFIVANDPDADRLAIAEKQSNGTWKIFTGNEIGCLLGWWAFHNHKKSNPDKYPGDHVFMLHSAVSSKILESIGNIEGFRSEETLTGFKWLANKAIDLMKQNKTVLFAFEEAIGFMYGPQVLDKDGICAVAVMAEMASYIYNTNMTVTGQLDALYRRYGVHVSNNSYYICHSKPTIEKIFKRIKTLENGTYPSKVAGIKVTSVRDLSGVGYDSNQADKVPILPTSTSSEMITFTLENGVKATIRTSGTEPKIKYYTEMASKPGESSDKSAVKEILDKVVSCLVDELLEPEKNGLQPRAE